MIETVAGHGPYTVQLRSSCQLIPSLLADCMQRCLAAATSALTGDSRDDGDGQSRRADSRSVRGADIADDGADCNGCGCL